MVAAMDRNVVAVDAMADNLAYISKSLNIINKADKVILVHNPIRYLCHTTTVDFYQPTQLKADQ